MAARSTLLLAFTLFTLAACGGKADGPKKVEACGNGMIDFAETCDTAIEGAGSCPTECESLSACAPMELIGNPNACTAECVVVETLCGDADGCCPIDCEVGEDEDCTSAALCGNGVLDDGETCDPASSSNRCECASTGALCTRSTSTGSAATCDLECSTEQILNCQNSDGCCPAGCSSSNDSDCSPTCGDGVIEGVEVCDGNCPTSCDDGDVCTTNNLNGSPALCSAECFFDPITSCISGDGCCAPGCSATNDSDCTSTCGDGVVEGAETCDGDCPTSCPAQAMCIEYVLTGNAAACNVMCTAQTVTQCVDGDRCCPASCTAANDTDCGAVCGDGMVEGSETCDGNCPATCNDGIACTTDVRSGSSATCDVACSFNPIVACVNNDGCCAPGCTAANDNDCSASCGNNVVEGNETCDGNCPSSCNDGLACTTDVLSGSAQSCTAECSYVDITACTDSDGCCPNGCVFANDNDCTCVPDTCASLGLNCGVLADDGCGGGGEVCGTCPASDSCVSNVCEPNFDIGDACTSDAQCNGGNGTCITQLSDGWDNGYCSSDCTTDAQCGAPNHCTPSIGCWQSCATDAECRPGYLCYDYDVDGRNECAPAGTGSGAVGAACEKYSDCGGGENGFCSPEASGQFKDGLCSELCTVDADCPTGSHCWSGAACLPDCTSDIDCRGAGFACIDDDGDSVNECFRFGNGAGAVGEACIGAWECATGAYAWCFTAEDGFPGGYCSKLCGAGQGICDASSVCGTDGSSDLCYDRCQNTNQCRTSYSCGDVGGAANGCTP